MYDGDDGGGYVSYKLTKWAFGSGELKMTFLKPAKFDFSKKRKK